MSQRRSHEEKLSWCPVASTATHATVKQATDQSTQRVSESGSWLVFYGWRDFVPQVVFPASACSRLEDAVLFKYIFYSLIFCCVLVIFSVMGCEPTIEINRVIEFILYDNLLQVILSLVIVKSVTGNVYLMNCWPLYRWNIQVCRTVLLGCTMCITAAYTWPIQTVRQLQQSVCYSVGNEMPRSALIVFDRCL